MDSTLKAAGRAAAVALAVWSATAAAHAQSPGRLLTTQAGNTIVECNTDGSSCVTVVSPAAAPTSASVSGNGTIAFDAILGLDGSCAPGGAGICRSHVFLMDADGRHVRQITFNPVDPSTFGGDNSAAISPDGTMVAFLSNRNVGFEADGTPRYMQEIYIVNSDGSSLRQVTFPVFGMPGTPQAGRLFGEVFGLAWSSDSSRLAFKGTTYGASPCGTFFDAPKECRVVGTINADGTGLTYRAVFELDADSTVFSIDWSPDGTLIAYGRSPSLGDPAIKFIDLTNEGRFVAGITAAQLGFQCTAPQCIHFSPDGGRLAYVNNGAVSSIALDGSARVDTSIAYGGGVSGASPPGIWWAPGSIAAPAQMTLAPALVEVWPGFTQQLTPSLLDAAANLILHTASSYSVFRSANPACFIQVGPHGLVWFSSGTGSDSGTITAANAGLTSNAVTYRCWPSPPCTFTVAPSTENFSSAGGSDVVSVSVNSGSNQSSCPWHTASNAAWITITSGDTGSGNNGVSFTVAVNTGAAREGTMTIAGSTVTITQDAPGAVLQSISVSPASTSIGVGDHQQFAATGHYSDGTSQDLTSMVSWSSSNTATATVSNAAGSEGIATGVAAGGPVTIKAALGAVNGTASLSVIALQSVTVSPTAPSVFVGATLQFTATAHYSDGSTADLTSSVVWSSSKPSIATITSSGGLATAVAKGTTSIRAVLSGLSASTTLTVKQAVLQSIVVTPSTATMAIGGRQQFTATGAFSDGSTRDVTSTVAWSSSSKMVASVSGGLATGLKRGTTTISAKSGKISGTATLTVQ